MERPLLLLSDLPSVKVHSVLKPGSQFGTADLDLKVTQEGRVFGGSVYADNYGNRNTGETRLGANLETRGLLGLGELLTASLFRASNLTTLGRLGVTLPVGPLGTKVSLSYTQLSYDVAGAFSNLNADGEGKIVSLLAQHPWTRSRNANLFLLAGVDVKKIEDRTAGAGSGTSSAAPNVDGRNINLLRLGVNGDFRDDVGGGALNSYSLSLFQGQNKIQTADTLLVDQRSTQTNGSFTKLQFEFLRLQSLASFLSEADSLALAVKGQLANKNLDASEKVSLGGPRGVRAFPVGAASGDDSLMLSAELRHRPGRLPALRGQRGAERLRGLRHRQGAAPRYQRGQQADPGCCRHRAERGEEGRLPGPSGTGQPRGRQRLHRRRGRHQEPRLAAGAEVVLRFL